MLTRVMLTLNLLLCLAALTGVYLLWTGSLHVYLGSPFRADQEIYPPLDRLVGEGARYNGAFVVVPGVLGPLGGGRSGLFISDSAAADTVPGAYVRLWLPEDCDVSAYFGRTIRVSGVFRFDPPEPSIEVSPSVFSAYDEGVEDSICSLEVWHRHTNGGTRP